MANKTYRFDLTGQDFKRNPFPTLADMRRIGPIVKTRIPLLGPMSFATTYEASTKLLKDTENFGLDATRAGKKGVMGLQWWLPKTFNLLAQNMLTKDDPDHRRLRQLVDKAFHRKTVESYRENIEKITENLLDQLEHSSDKDLVKNFARELPLAVICDLLGLPQQDRPQFTKWMSSLTTITSVFGIFTLLPSVKKMIKYLRNHFELRRKDPKDDMISTLVLAEEQGDKLSEDELLAMCFLLFVAGHETTTHLISGGTLALLQNEEQLDTLKSDWSLAPKAVDELLRFVCPVQITKPRFALNDIDFCGKKIKRGQPLMAMLASANADPSTFERPEQLNITLDRKRHLAFGDGPHFCLGFLLAKLEAEIAFERLFTRYPNLQLAVPEENLRWTKRIGLRALISLPLKV